MSKKLFNLFLVLGLGLAVPAFGMDGDNFNLGTEAKSQSMSTTAKIGMFGSATALFSGAGLLYVYRKPVKGFCGGLCRKARENASGIFLASLFVGGSACAGGAFAASRVRTVVKGVQAQKEDAVGFFQTLFEIFKQKGIWGLFTFGETFREAKMQAQQNRNQQQPADVAVFQNQVPVDPNHFYDPKNKANFTEGSSLPQLVGNGLQPRLFCSTARTIRRGGRGFRDPSW